MPVAGIWERGFHEIVIVAGGALLSGISKDFPYHWCGIVSPQPLHHHLFSMLSGVWVVPFLDFLFSLPLFIAI